MEYRSRGSSTVLFGLLALLIVGLAVVVFDGPPLVEDPVSIERVEWDDPCSHFYTDVENEMGAASLSARYGLPANLTVSGLGEIAAVGCMAGSDTGLEAIVVHRRDGDSVYSDYIIADGGAAFDWVEWFAVTQPNVTLRPIEHGWTSEPPGLSDGLPDQPVWERLPDVIRSANDE